MEDVATCPTAAKSHGVRSCIGLVPKEASSGARAEKILGIVFLGLSDGL